MRYEVLGRRVEGMKEVANTFSSDSLQFGKLHVHIHKVEMTVRHKAL